MQVILSIALLLLFLFLFIRQVKIDREEMYERDRRGDEHMLKEIDRWKKENNIR